MEIIFLELWDVELVGIGCCWGKNMEDVVYIFIGYKIGKNLDKVIVLKVLKVVLESIEYFKVF